MQGREGKKSFKEQICPAPISACDLLKKLLNSQDKMPQPDVQFPRIEIEELSNHYGQTHPLMLRAQCACQLKMVINPQSFFETVTKFIPADEFETRYKAAEKEYESSIRIGAPLGRPSIG